MLLRNALFWLHLAAGVIAGSVILLLSLTGVLLAFEKQIVAYAERGLRATASEAAQPLLPPSTILEAATNASPGSRPSNLVVRSDPGAPIAVTFGREKTLFVHPYTGRVLGEGASGVRAFFQVNEQLHRWLAMRGDGREQGKAITGAANLAFLFIVLSGLVIWLPRRWTRSTVRNATLFRNGLRGRARDFNWHQVFGFWFFIPLLAIVASGVVISYPWASGLVYRAFGDTPPTRQDSRSSRGGEELDPSALDRLTLAARAEATRVAPAWTSLSVRLPLPARGPVTFALDTGNGARPDKRSQLLLDAQTTRIIEHKTYSQQKAGQQARAWLRWIHTGEAGGIAGQFVAMLASGAAVVLVYTGLALSLRRFIRYLKTTRSRSEQMIEEELSA